MAVNQIGRFCFRYQTSILQAVGGLQTCRQNILQAVGGLQTCRQNSRRLYKPWLFIRASSSKTINTEPKHPKNTGTEQDASSHDKDGIEQLNYFQNLVSDVQAADQMPAGVSKNPNAFTSKKTFKYNRDGKETIQLEDQIVAPDGVQQDSLMHQYNHSDMRSDQLAEDESSPSRPLGVIKPALKVKSHNLAAYVNESETLSNLVKLGVDLSQVETKHKEAAKHLLKTDFQSDIQPYLLFLHNVGVPDLELGRFFTKNPDIFMQDLDNLQVRINYFLSKKFTSEAVARICCKAPTVLCRTTKNIDSQLGYLQKEFHISGEEVRDVITRLPKLITWPKVLIQDNKFTLKEFLGFSPDQMKQLLLVQPKIYLSNKKALVERFDFIHNTMGISHQQIIDWPNVLRSRLMIIKQRFQFLKLLGRDQFDYSKENYISLKALVSGRDADFCKQVAKVPASEYNAFLKTI